MQTARREFILNSQRRRNGLLADIVETVGRGLPHEEPCFVPRAREEHTSLLTEYPELCAFLSHGYWSHHEFQFCLLCVFKKKKSPWILSAV